MSRDPRDAPDVDDMDDVEGAAAFRRGPIDPERRAALVTAYVDGVAELPPDERRDVEAHLARDPGARAEADAVHALLDRLRALPPNDGAEEPDWAAMERSIRQAVATAPTRPWWRRWRWLVPAMTCATAAAVLFVIWPRAAPLPIPERPQRASNAESAEPGAAEPPAGGTVVALWLDGSEVDVDVSVPDELGDLGIDFGAMQTLQAIPHTIPQTIEDADEVGLLPATDLAWVDHLDDAALDRVERWLANPADLTRPNRPVRSQGSQGSEGKKI